MDGTEPVVSQPEGLPGGGQQQKPKNGKENEKATKQLVAKKKL